MSKQANVYLCAPVRTAIGSYGGMYKNTSATSLGATALAACVSRSGAPAEAIDGVIMGQVLQAGAKMNPARQAAIHAGLGVTVPALTVNRVCGSGAQAIASAAQEIMLGYADCVLAGGMESMDQAPYLLPQGRWGQRSGHANVYDSLLHDGLNDAFSDQHSGWHSEDLARELGIDRESQDSWALRSQLRFAAAQAAQRFDAEIAPVTVRQGKSDTTVDQDEHNRPQTTIEALAKLKPVFRDDGTITAGNSPGLNSGAAAVLLASETALQRHNLESIGRLVAVGIGAVEPGMFGLGPVPAVEQALRRADWRTEDLQRVEINEAFAVIALALQRALRLPEEIVNVDGGAIAHGHPIGATGAVLTTRLLHSMARDGLQRGMVTLCIGGGQGIALAIEAM